MKNSIISVIIPIYRSESYFDRCINSVINQTYKNLEIILVDDGSPDNCPKMCDEYAKKDKRIKVIHKKNEGVSTARNCGIAQARGEYISFIDSDDYLEINMYEKMMKKIYQNKLDLCVCNYSYENEKQEKLSINKSIDFVEKRSNYPRLSYENDSILGYIWNKLYSSSLIKQKVNFNNNYSIMEDDLFNYEVFDKNKEFKWGYINEELYHYIKYDKKVTITKNKYFFSAFDLMEREIEILNKNNVDSDYRKASYVTNYCRAKYYIKINKIKNYDKYKYKNIKRKVKEYTFQVRNNKICNKDRKKYFVSKFFPFFYYFDLKFRKRDMTFLLK